MTALHRISIVLATFFCFIFTLSADQLKRVLLADSYAFGDPWVSELSQTFRRTLNEANQMICYEIFQFGVRYQLDVKPADEDVAALQARLNFGRYDLIVAINNDVGDLFMQGKLKALRDAPILLMRYNGAPPDGIQQKMNITGLLGSIRNFDNIEFGAQLLSDAKHFVVLIEPSASGQRQREPFQALPEAIRQKTRLICGAEFSTVEMLKQVAELSPDSILIFNAWGSARDGAVGTPGAIVAKLRDAFPGLILGRLDSYMQMGVDGGSLSICGEEAQKSGTDGDPDSGR